MANTNSLIATNAATSDEEKKKKELLAALGISEEQKTGAEAAGTAPTTPAVTEKTSGEKMKELQDAIINRKDFSYDAEKDPKYASLYKANIRESRRATADALAAAAANTGGVASSYAVTAATEAGDYYASKMSDELAALYDDAYNKYLQEHQLKQNDLSILDAEYERRYQLAMQMANLGDDSYLRALADEYGGKKTEGNDTTVSKPTYSGTSGSSGGGYSYSYTLPQPSDDTEEDTGYDGEEEAENAGTGENDIVEELPEPTKDDDDDKGEITVSTEDGKSNYNAGWIDSGKTRDEYDASVRKKSVSTLGGTTNAYNYLKSLDDDIEILSERGFGAFKSQTNAVLNGKKVGYKGNDPILKYAADYCNTYADYLNFMLGYIS